MCSLERPTEVAYVEVLEAGCPVLLAKEHILRDALALPYLQDQDNVRQQNCAAVACERRLFAGPGSAARVPRLTREASRTASRAD